MNTRLLRKVQRQILDEPRQVIMETWFSNLDGGTHLPRAIPNCGTAGCIGGWAIAIARKLTPKKAREKAVGQFLNYERDAAGELLDITESQGGRLFSINYWPLDFMRRYGKTQPQTLARAKVIAARIDHFIKTKGRE